MIYSEFTAGKTYHIEYKDNNGNTTSRNIRILYTYTSRYGKDYIVAFCNKRKETRTFRADRIISKEIVEYKTTKQKIDSNPKAVTPVLNYNISNSDVQNNKSEKSKNNSEKQYSYNDNSNTKQENEPGVLEKIKGFFIKAVFAVIMLFILSPFLSKYFNLSSSLPEYKYHADIKTITLPVEENTSYKQAATFINNDLFKKETGIRNEKLNNMYAKADTNNDFSLSWNEIRTFQNKLTGNYKYINNDTALKPDEFIAEGGGDCEDWSLITCGLLRYWDITTYVGQLASPDGDTAHAICLIYQNTKPEWGLYYYISQNTFTSYSPHAGYYIPIDYEHVGGLSSSVDENWILEAIYDPQDLYGKVM